MASDAEKKVLLELTGDEALVLFDWLARFNKAKALRLRTKPNSVFFSILNRCWKAG